MQRKKCISWLVGAVTIAMTWLANGEDWPRWRGPQLNGISTEKDWTAQWPQGGPQKLWTANVGVGFASFTVANGRVYTTGNANGKDTVYCFDAQTGKVLWQHSYEHPLDDKYFEGGTAATPTVDGSFVYQLSRRGHLFCLDAATGKVLWGKNLAAETGARMPEWGFSSSPLVEGDLLILNMGEHGTAVNKKTGEVVWKSGPGAAGYASAVPFTEEGRTRLAIFGAKSLFAVEKDTGAMAWSFPWKTSYDVNAADPIISGNTVFLSSSYGTGAGLIEFKQGKATAIWQNKSMRNHFNSCVLIDGYLYGCSGEAGSASHLMCLEHKTGQVKWTEKSVGLGSLMAADGKLIVMSDKGELIIAKAQPTGFEALARAKVLSGKCWTTPVLANGRIYCRNAAGNVVCLDVKK